MRLLLTAMHQHARERPAEIAIVDPDGRAWTYQALQARVHDLATELRACAPAVGIVAIQLPPGGALWAATLAITQEGLDALLLPERAHARLLERVDQELRPICTIVIEDGQLRVRKNQESTGRVEESADANETIDARDAHAGGIILVSSGTTGWSRFVRRSPQAVDAIARGLLDADLYRVDDVVGSFLPMSHAYGFEHAFLGPLLAGARVEQRSAFSLACAEELLQRGVTVLPLVPATLAALGESLPVQVRQSRLRSVVVAGSPLARSIRAAFQSACSLEVIDLYGATELGTIWLDRGSGGVPVSGVAVCIADPEWRDRMHEQPRGTPGEIVVRSVTQCDRFVGERQGPDEVIDGYFRTGDLGVHGADGSLRIVGRLKLVFDVGGLKVNPFEVEAAIVEHASVRAAIVEPVELAAGVQRVAARVELRDSADAPSAGALRDFLQGRVPEHAVPRAIQFVAQLPRTASGKVLRTPQSVASCTESAAAPAASPVTNRRAALRVRGTREAWTRQLFDASARGYDVASGSAFLGSGRWYRRRMLLQSGLRRGMALLDVGSGTGLCAHLAQQMVGAEGRVVALDPSPGMLEVARKRGVRETLVGQAGLLPLPNASFDIVVMSYMMRHIENLTTAFTEARRVLRPGGKLVILEVTTPTGRVSAGAFRIAMRHALPSLGVLTSGRLSTYPMMQFWAETIDQAEGPDVIVAALQRAGFSGARHVRELGIFSCYRGVAV